MLDFIIMTEQTKIWRLDPPACDCDKLCKNPEHDRPEWRLVSDIDIRPAGAIGVHEPRLGSPAGVVKSVNTGDLKSPGPRPLRVQVPPSA